MRKPTDGLDYATRDFQGFKQMMIEKLKQKVPEYTDFSDSDLGIILIELLAYGQDIQSYYIDRTANEVNLSTAIERQNVMELCGNLGYTLKNVTPSQFEQVFEVTNPSNENPFVIPEGFVVTTQGNDFEPSIQFELYEELVIPPGKTGLEQDEHSKYLYSGIVVQGRTVRNELLGTSKGTPDLELYLWEYPVITESIKVSVNEGSGFEEWTRVNNFINSNSTDKHYTVKVDSTGRTRIVFGNGIVGKIPEAYEDGIIATYRVGGGTQGNVTSNTITQIPSQLANLGRTFNPYTPKVMGEDMETIDSAKINALRGLRTIERAVTLQDHKDLAFKLEFVLLSNAEEVPDGLTVNIYLVSKYGQTLSEEEKEKALELYNKHKMIGVKPVIKDASYLPLNFDVTVSKNRYDDTDYETLVPSVLKDYFKVGNYNFAQSYSQIKLLRELMLILANAEDINVSVKNNPSSIQPSQIITCGTVNVTVKEV